MTVFLAILSIASYAGVVHTVLPPQCLANFRWDDCGKPPQTAIYYWRVASRCEVGIWRGCLPNINMFRDEYECVSTCTFSVRAGAQNFHELNYVEQDFTTQNYDEDYKLYTTDENGLNDSTTLAADITTVDAPGEGDEKKNEGENKEGGNDDKGDEKKEEKDGEKDTPDEKGKDAETEGEATTEAGADANTENENPEEPNVEEEEA